MKYIGQSILIFLVATATSLVLPSVNGAPNMNLDRSRIYFPDELRGITALQRCQNNPNCKTGLFFAGIPDACGAIGETVDVRTSGRGCNPFAGEVVWPATGECVELLTQGPCPDGYWIKLNLQDFLPVCEPRPCDMGQALVEVKGGRRCLSLENQKGCPPGQFLVNNEFGIGECDCQPGKAYHRPTRACYRVYSQGPCNQGYIFKVLDEAGSSTAKCIPNPCPKENMVMLNSQCQIHQNGSCYELGSKGPCVSGILAIDRVLMEPVCVLETENHGFITVQRENKCPVGEYSDSSGDCRVPFRMSNTRRCLRGSIRDQLGRCRKNFSSDSAKRGNPSCPDNLVMLGGACYSLTV